MADMKKVYNDLIIINLYFYELKYVTYHWASFFSIQAKYKSSSTAANVQWHQQH